MYIIAFISVYIVSSGICNFVVKSKGKNPVFWGVIGGVLGPLVIPFVFLSK